MGRKDPQSDNGMTTNLRSFVDSDLKLGGLSILVTGGTGSFGQAFVQTVLERYDVHRIIVFSRDEAKQHDMSLQVTQRFDILLVTCEMQIGWKWRCERLTLSFMPLP